MVIYLNEFIAVGVAAVKHPPPYWRFHFYFPLVSYLVVSHTGPRQAKNMSLSMSKMRGFRSSCAV